LKSSRAVLPIATSTESQHALSNSFTASLDNGEWAVDRWYLGEKPGSLGLQNARLRCFCERPDDFKEGDINSTISELAGGYLVERAWDQADFTNDLDKGFDIENDQGYWGSKQILRFYLDFFAFFGTREAMVRRIHETGGEHVVQLLMIVEAATKPVVSMALLTKRIISTDISSMRGRSTHLLRLPNSTPSQIAPICCLDESTERGPR
jgi:hypothetical protein